jgi:hypothetical protein
VVVHDLQPPNTQHSLGVSFSLSLSAPSDRTKLTLTVMKKALERNEPICISRKARRKSEEVGSEIK